MGTGSCNVNAEQAEIREIRQLILAIRRGNSQHILSRVRRWKNRKGVVVIARFVAEILTVSRCCHEQHTLTIEPRDLLLLELEYLGSVRNPERPLLVVIGGAKVSDKIAVLDELAPHADTLAIGGAMAYSFLAPRGESIGNSLVEPDAFDDARRVEEACRAADTRLLLPTDHLIAEQISPDAPTRTVEKIPDGWMGVDIGPETARRYADAARAARTVFWNGPMGIFEIESQPSPM